MSVGRFAFIASVLAVVALLVGCDAPAPAKKSPVSIEQFQALDLGAAAEARAWEFGDGSCWCVIGRPERFIVYRKVDGAWRATEAIGPIVDLAGLTPPEKPAVAYGATAPVTPAEAKP